MPLVKKYTISKEDLYHFYFQQKFSTAKIASVFGCSHATVLNRMKEYGLPRRSKLGLRKPLSLSKTTLNYLYNTRSLSAEKIAKIIHRSRGGVERKIKQFDIKTRNINNRACKYKKKDFSGDPIEKAYMIGFRLGDLNVYKRKNVIVVRCSTTKRAQVSLIKNLLSPYGGINISKAKRGTYEIYVFLNNSFDFLLPKEDKIPTWITKNNKYFLAFFAGYADAEGYLCLNNSRGKRVKSFAVFGLSSYDRRILQQLRREFKYLNINFPSLYLSSPKGTPCANKEGRNYFSNGNAWCLTTARKASLWKLIYFWEKYSRHKDKKKAIRKAKENLILRNQLPYCRKIDLTIPKMV